MSKPELALMGFNKNSNNENNINMTPPISSPLGYYYEQEHRMVSNPIKHKPFDKINDIIKTLSSAKLIQNTGKGTRSSGQIVEINGIKYILRKTNVSNKQVRDALINEQLIYSILEKDPKYKNYISNLLYADVPLVHHQSEAYNNAYFIFEYQDGTTLDKFTEENKDKYTYEELLILVTNINTALKFIDSRGIIHRDIKPDNIFIDKSRENLPLIFDFDISCRKGIDCKTGEFIGTRKYMTNGAKVILNKISNPFATYDYNHYYDLHSLAVIIEEDLVKLAKPSDKEKILKYGQLLRNQLKMYGGKRKTRKGGRRIGVLNPSWGGACPCPNLSKLPIPMGQTLKGGRRGLKENRKKLRSNRTRKVS
jgi:serine/threonine protein kinase